ncbi:MAG: dimethylarginine dimethylaminohydrolase family protein [Blastocatellia bacterium]|nr:dimethylarginine dimethylaminohydrolase family protein [Blastocatellia bacterium]
MSHSNRYLMCQPHYFDVRYIINPWMAGNINRTSANLASQQWRNLYEIIAQHAEIELIDPEPGLPDMVFTANAGFVFENKILLSRFFHPERRGEEPHFDRWLAEHDYEVMKSPPEVPFEGAGDALIDRENPWIWGGYGWRSSLESHAYLKKAAGMEVISLRLVDDRFYHLDTCLCPLESGYIMYYPAAFAEESRRLIAMRVPLEKRIIVPEEDAIEFACNAVNIGRLVILNKTSRELVAKLTQAGFEVAQTELSEFLKAGGAAKCLTLRLNEPLLSEYRDGR